MPEFVLPLDVMVRWEPSDPHAVLLADDAGRTVLALDPHPDDGDRRCVVLTWQGSRSAAMSGPSEYAVAGHRLWDRGLRDVAWVGVVQGSRLVSDIEAGPAHREPFRSLAHHVVLLDNCTVEVVAELLVVTRRPGVTSDAAAAALRSDADD
jgi:hypothetical protein